MAPHQVRRLWADNCNANIAHSWSCLPRVTSLRAAETVTFSWLFALLRRVSILNVQRMTAATASAYVKRCHLHQHPFCCHGFIVMLQLSFFHYQPFSSGSPVTVCHKVSCHQSAVTAPTSLSWLKPPPLHFVYLQMLAETGQCFWEILKKVL